MKKPYLVAVLFLIFISIRAAPCPQLCQNCTSGVCVSCYQDWTVDASTLPQTDCGCPVGYYMNSTNRICNFCPVECITCSSYTYCTSCLDGYKLYNGLCKTNFTNSTLKIGIDLTNDEQKKFNVNGFTFQSTGATSSVNYYFSFCDYMPGQPFMGRYAFDYDSIVTRTYYGLPYHQWAMIKFQFFIIDNWLNQDFIVEIEGQRNHEPTIFGTTLTSQSFTYSEDIRNTNFCGQPQFKDSLGIFNQSFMHGDSILKFRIKTSLRDVSNDQLPANAQDIYFGIREVLLITGICPQNCLTCASKYLCGSCTQLFVLDNFKCICDTNIAFVAGNGKCIKKCVSLTQVYRDNKCIPCGLEVDGCVSCANRTTSQRRYENDLYKCIECAPGLFLSQGQCVPVCPNPFYQKIQIVSATNVLYTCVRCPQGCTSCEYNVTYVTGNGLQIICSSCQIGYYWYQGECLTVCPTGTFVNSRQTACAACAQGCLSCTSLTNCTNCYQNSVSTGVSYLNQNGICMLVCTLNTTIVYNPQIGCPNTVCSVNCDKCVGTLNTQCYQCISPYLLQNYQCVNACGTGYYQPTPISALCVKCWETCEQCTSAGCTKCKTGYWIMNGQCVLSCPQTYFQFNNGGVGTCVRCTDPNCKQCVELPPTLVTARNGGSQCQQCQYPYYLNPSTKECQIDEPPCLQKYYYNQIIQSCLPCPINCLSCLSTLCYKCEPPTILNNGQCVSQCPQQKIPIVQQISYLPNGTPVEYKKCIWSDPLCQTYVDNVCVECAYVNPSLIRVVNQTTGMAECIYSCPDGYARSSISTQTCLIVCPSNCLQCDSQANCIKCANGYLIFNYTCVTACPTSYISDSVQCTKCDANCVKCQQDGKCIQCQSPLVLSTSGYCYTPNCPVSQYNTTTSSCTVCNTVCLTCTDKSYECTSCPSGKVLSSSFICTTSCLQGQFIDAISQTCKPCRPTCKSCSNFENCTLCQSDYYMFKKSVSPPITKCLSQCPSGTYISTNTSIMQCLPCKFPCLTCYGQNEYQCLQCVNGYELDHTTCVLNCPSNKYEDAYGHCELCHVSCQSCFGPADFQCITCNNLNGEQDDDQMYVFEGRCYHNYCPTATYKRQQQNVCVPCKYACVECTSNATCTNCQYGYILANASCVQVCPYNTYYNQSSTACQLCNSTFDTLCQQCQSSGCTRCVLPYYRYNRTCVITCPMGTYMADHNLRQCLPCPHRCLTCTSFSSCQVCKNKFRLQDGICKSKCDSGYFYNTTAGICVACTNATTTGHCSGCVYSANYNRMDCVYCDDGYVLIKDSITNVTSCVQSINGCPIGYYYLLSDPKTCQLCQPACLSCSYSSTNCTQCKPTYKLVNNMCISQTVPPSCPQHCSLCSNSTACIVCALPYYYYPVNSTCVTDCPSQYYPNMRQCIQCGQGCQVCLNNAYECTQCKQGFYLLGDKCLRDCPSGYYNQLNADPTASDTCQLCGLYLQGCQICIDSTTCSKCQSQYSLFQTGKCYLKPKCPIQYYFSYQSQTCVECAPHCVSCANANMCIVCESGFTLYNSTCTNMSCPYGTYSQRMQYNMANVVSQGENIYVGSRCSACLPPCQACQSQQICISCINGYMVSNSSCVSNCGQQYYATNTSNPTCQKCSISCLSCRTNSTTCTSCRVGFYLYNKKCVIDCPISMYQSLNDNTCHSCSAYCTQCTQTSECQVCYDGMWLLEGECVPECPGGYAGTMVEQSVSIYNRILHICTKCQPPCLTCNRSSSQYQCLSCRIGYYLYQSRCLQSCPSGYFNNNMTSICTQCPSWCLTCSSYQSCSTCSNSACLQPCEMTNPVSCYSCETSCKYCDKSTPISINSTSRVGTCLECMVPYYLYMGRCVLVCPSSYYANYMTSTCQPCGCLQCNSYGKCTQCNTTSQYLYNGLCYNACPMGTIPTTTTTNTNTNTTSIVNICIINPCINSTSFSNTSSLNSTCTSCVAPYILSANLTCALSCAASTYISSTSNTCQPCPFQCKTCTSYTNCTQCRTAYWMQQDTLNSGGFNTNANTSSFSSNWICVSQCTSGTYPTSLVYNNKTYNICRSCVRAMVGCQLCYDNDTCLSCFGGSYLLSNTTTNQTTCTQICPKGYYINTDSLVNACLKCNQQNCIQCTYTTANGYKCLACTNNMYLVADLGVCVTTCAAGYYPFTPNSATTNNTTIISSKQCQPCPQQCLTCINQTVCLKCRLNYMFDPYSGRCLVACGTGMYKYYNSTMNMYMCAKCDSTCVDCLLVQNRSTLGTSVSFSDQFCIVCAPTYLMLNGMCYPSQCPNGYYNVSNQCRECNSFCLSCSSPSNCTQCYPGYILTPSTGTCTSSCSLSSQFYHPITRTCQLCSSQCYQCFGYRYDQCLSCWYPLMLMGSTCVSFCPSGYQPSTNGICVQCHSTCKQCTGSGSSMKCTICFAGMFLYMPTPLMPPQGQCVKQCPISTFANPLPNQCQLCSTVLPYCSQCSYNPVSQLPQCTKCSSSSLTVITDTSFTCEPPSYTCPQFYMYTNQNNICRKCPPPCISCKVKSTSVIPYVLDCYKCSYGYAWYNGLCLAVCPAYTTPVITSPTFNTVVLTNILMCLDCQQTNCIRCRINQTSPSATVCQVCASPYILFNNTCILSCPPSYTLTYNQNKLVWECLNTTQIINSCISRSMLTLINNYSQTVCVDVCPAMYYPDYTTHMCNICPLGCAVCSSPSMCITCQPGFFKYNNLCVMNCPLRYLTISDRCLQCVSPCATCTSSLLRCTTCINGYILLDGSCLLNCPPRYYLSQTLMSNINICSPCLPQCQTCIDNSSCLTCRNLAYSAPQCNDTTNRCSSSQYVTSASGCSPCHTSCLSCFGPLQFNCMTCLSSLTLMNGQCLPSCPSGYYLLPLSSANNTCIQCTTVIPNCINCANTSGLVICRQCSTSFTLVPDGSKCVNSCSQLNTANQIYSISSSNSKYCGACIVGCQLCVLQICYKCAMPLVLYINGASNGRECMSSCPVGTYQTPTYQCFNCSANCLVCTSPINCIQCVGASNCSGCNSNYILNNGYCTSSCANSSSPIEIPNQIASTTTSQLQCMPCNVTIPKCKYCAYTVTFAALPNSNSQVVSSNTVCTICQYPYVVNNGNGRCNACIDTMYYDSIAKICRYCNNTCQTCSSATLCLTCKAGYMLNSYAQCVTVCTSAQYYVATTATSCYPCATAIPNCIQCLNATTCTLCQSSYYLISPTTALAISYTGPSCVQICPSMTTINNQLCQPCLTTNCLSCPVLSSCQQCVNGYYLLNSKCVAVCPTGMTSLVVALGPDVCISCKSGCVICSNQANTCDQCGPGLADRGNGECIYDNSNTVCPSGQYVYQDDPLLCASCHSSCMQCWGPSSFQCLSCRLAGYVYQNGYCISTCASSQFYNEATDLCQSCTSPCLTCAVTSTSCTSCASPYFLSSSTCLASCPANTYRSNSQCKSCPTYCLTCSSASNCITCTTQATIYYNSICYIVCPTGSYIVHSTISGQLDSCAACPTQCLSCTSSTVCQACANGYYLYLNQCNTECPTEYYKQVSINVCQQCSNLCLQCTSSTSCNKCDTSTVLYNSQCIPSCPSGTFEYLLFNYRYCSSCQNCSTCTSLNSCTACNNGYLLVQYSNSTTTCELQCPSGYSQSIDTNTNTDICIPNHCINCASCINGNCIQCQPDHYLFNNLCVDACADGYYNQNTTWKCQPCMQDCLICPNATFCTQCIVGFNFSISLDNRCVNQAILLYGPAANISGFTSNITAITSLVYLSTSAGPVFFGEMSTTYFNIQFCQFMFFHDAVAGSNSQMKTFLNSLSFMSMSTSSQNNQNTTNTTTRRLLLQTQAVSFLQINVPIFIMMACFLALYGITHLLIKYIDGMFLSCPNFKFYLKQIFIYMSNRFKWIYFDFVAWLSYLPFLYFSIVQVQRFNFNDALNGFSSILAIIILGTYPLYPILIAYNIKKNYVAICMQNDKMVEMSLSPWIWKVKRPQMIPSENEPFIYCTRDNWRLLFYPLKYLRKFIFVVVVAVCPLPVASLSILIAMNVMFIGYMSAFKPREMPYIIFDFILEGVMMAFEVFMLIYMSLDSSKITAMSIVTHAFGFLSANLSIVIAIVLNIVAYYKIFMCIYELVQHLKEKMDEKQKMQAKQKDGNMMDQQQGMNHNNNDYMYQNQQFLLDQKQLEVNKKQKNDDSLTEVEAKLEHLQKEERDIANLLSDKDLLMNNIQPRYDGGDFSENRIQGNQGNLFDDKEMFADIRMSNNPNIRNTTKNTNQNNDKLKTNNNKKNQNNNSNNNNKMEEYDDELPTMKTNKNKKDRLNSKQDAKNNKATKKQGSKPNLEDSAQYMLRSKRNQEQWNQFVQGQGDNQYRMSSQDRLPLGKQKTKSNQQYKINELNYRQKNSNKTAGIRIDQDDINRDFKASKNKKQKIEQAQINSREKIKTLQSQQNLKNDSSLSNQYLNIDSSPQKFGKRGGNVQTLNYQTLHVNSKQNTNNDKSNLQTIGTYKLDKKIDKNKKIQPIQNQFGQFQQVSYQDTIKEKNKYKRKQQQQYNEEISNAKYKRKQKNVYRQDNRESNTNLQQAQLQERYKKHSSNLIDLSRQSKNKDQQANIGYLQRNAHKKQHQRSKINLVDSQINEVKTKQVTRNGSKNNLFFNEQDQQQLTQEVKIKDHTKKNKQFNDKDQPMNQYVQQGILKSRKPKRGDNKNTSQNNYAKEYQTQQLRTKQRQNLKRAQQNIGQNQKNKNVQQPIYNERTKKQTSRNASKDKNKEQSNLPQGVLSNRQRNLKNNEKIRNPTENKQENIQELRAAERVRKQQSDHEQQSKEQQGGFFSNLFGRNKSKAAKIVNEFGHQKDYSIQEINSKNRNIQKIKKRQSGFTQFEQSASPTRPLKQDSKSRLNSRLGKMTIEGGQNDNQDYDQIKRKNQQSKTTSKINNAKMNLDQSDDKFQQSNYERPNSRSKKHESGKDSGLFVNQKDSIDHRQDNRYNSRKIRAQNKEKARIKGNMKIRDDIDQLENEDEITRKKKQQEQVIKRGGKGRLNIQRLQNTEGDQDLQNIQL